MKFQHKGAKLFNWFLARPTTTGALIFVLMSLMVSYVVTQRYLVIKENENREMNNVLTVVQQNIDQALKSCYTTAFSVALTINDAGVPENFDYIASRLIESNPNISAIELVPDGIIRYIYPMKGNEQALNLNILKLPKHRKEALKSLATKKMYFAGPLKLQQEGIGIVGRLPVYKKNKLWGFSAVVIKLETMLKESGINSVDQSKYFFQISKLDPVSRKEVFFLPNKDFADHNYISRDIPDGDWKLYLILKSHYTIYSYLILTALLGFAFALLFGILITLLLKNHSELQVLVFKQNRKIDSTEAKFKTIFDQAAVGIANVDINTGNFLETNKQYCHLMGYSMHELKSKNFQSITHPDDLNKDLLNLENLKAGRIKEFSSEKRYVTKSGAIIWANLIVSALWKQNETPTTCIAIVEDITIKKEAEDLVKKSETHFRSLFSDSPVALWEEDFSEVKKYLRTLNLINKNKIKVATYLNQHPEVVNKCISLLKIIDINNECVVLFAPKTKKELLSSEMIITGKKAIEAFIKQLSAICSGQLNLAMDSQIETPEGGTKDIHLRWSVMKGYEDSLERVIVSTEDITTRKKSEKIIIESQQKIEDLVNSIDGIVWECDFETLALTFISKKAEDIMGFTTDEWKSDIDFWEKHIHPEDRERSVFSFRSLIKDDKQKDSEYRMITKDGTVIWVRELINVIFENKKPVSFRGIIIDITKTKEAEKDLKNSFDLVTEQNKRLLNFSYIVSHNLRSHTSNIASITSLLNTCDSEEEKNEMLQLLQSVAASLSETMNNLNEVVSIQTNIGLVSEKLNLKLYIDNVQTLLSEQIGLKKVTIVSDVSEEVTINYNPAYLESILFNLISNAIRYSHPDREAFIKVNWHQENNMNVLKVADNGIGIDLIRNGDKIFGMYKTFSKNPDSRGIGLFITKNQVDAMGGNITVESTINVGTQFNVFIK